MEATEAEAEVEALALLHAAHLDIYLRGNMFSDRLATRRLPLKPLLPPLLPTASRGASSQTEAGGEQRAVNAGSGVEMDSALLEARDLVPLVLEEAL